MILSFHSIPSMYRYLKINQRQNNAHHQLTVLTTTDKNYKQQQTKTFMSFRYPSKTVLLSWDCEQKIKFLSHLSCGCWLPPVSPTDLWRLDVTWSVCAPAISFFYLLESSCARQMFTAFCRFSVFSRRSSSCIFSVTENTILPRNILSFISPKLHKFARDLRYVTNELPERFVICHILNLCVSMTLISGYSTLQACLELSVDRLYLHRQQTQNVRTLLVPGHPHNAEW